MLIFKLVTDRRTRVGRWCSRRAAASPSPLLSRTGATPTTQVTWQLLGKYCYDDSCIVACVLCTTLHIWTFEPQIENLEIHLNYFGCILIFLFQYRNINKYYEYIYQNLLRFFIHFTLPCPYLGTCSIQIAVSCELQTPTTNNQLSLV